MTILLDTHILLWWLANDPLLPKKALRLIADDSSAVFVSSATAWEIAIKKTAGKLTAPANLEAALEASRFEPLPIAMRHALLAGRLPRHHADPFDRMLVAQAQLEGMILVTHDRRLSVYGHFVQVV